MIQPTQLQVTTMGLRATWIRAASFSQICYNSSVICILKNEEPKHAISSSRLRQIFLLHYLKQTLSISNARSAPILVACTPPVNEMVINKRKGYAPLPVPDNLDKKMLLPSIFVGPGGLHAPCVLACAMRSLAIVFTIVQSFSLSFFSSVFCF